MGNLTASELKELLDQANKLLDKAYKRIEQLEDIIEINNSNSGNFYAILIANDCSYHRLIEKDDNKLICLDCGIIYCITEINRDALMPQSISPHLKSLF